MKKRSLFYSLLFIASLGFLASCGGDEEDPKPVTPDECASATYPASTGTATLSILNFQNSEIAVSAGDLVSFAVSVKKGDNRTQKLRVYQSDCKNTLGTVVEFKGQPKFSGDAFDLRNTDDEQVRNVNYTVPTGMSTIYLSFVSDESGDKFTYKQVTLKVSGSGVIDTYTSVQLGAQDNQTVDSRIISTTGQTFNACDAVANIDYIDVTYITNGGKSYLSSNPERSNASGIFKRGTTITCDGASVSIAGGVATLFKATDVSFADATDASLSGLDLTGANSYVEITTNKVYAFKTSNNRLGLIKVNSGADGTAAGAISVDIKVQR